MSGVCGTRTEEVQLKTAGNCSELCEFVGVPASEKESMSFRVKVCVGVSVYDWAADPYDHTHVHTNTLCPPQQ